MRQHGLISLLFYVAAAYDAILGLGFIFAAARIFEYFGVTPPNHLGYIHFPAALLLVFALMFLAIASRPVQNRNLISYGILLKASYCGVVAWHWLVADIPFMWKPFAFLDLIFAVLFIGAYLQLSREPGHLQSANGSKI